MAGTAELLELLGRFLGGAPLGETVKAEAGHPNGLWLLARVSGPAPRRTVRETQKTKRRAAVDVTRRAADRAKERLRDRKVNGFACETFSVLPCNPDRAPCLVARIASTSGDGRDRGTSRGGGARAASV
jgi:hypothetical protein